MSLQAPNLDDRSFDQLVRAAAVEFQRRNPDWPGLSIHDPGAMLLEVFAYLTEILIFRLNRVPEKSYVEFLRLLGVKLHPSAAARVELEFSLQVPRETTLTIPRDTQVMSSRSSADRQLVVFQTVQTVALEPGQLKLTVPALCCEQVDAELVGHGTGMGGQRVRVARPPIIAATGDVLDVVVGIETAETEIGNRDSFRKVGGKTFRIWTEVDGFVGTVSSASDAGTVAYRYVLDRAVGEIAFAPAVMGTQADGSLEPRPVAHSAVPAAAREIRVWYRRGGGPHGNVARGSLDTLRTPIAGLSVTNPSPAIGGREPESLDNALVRGPQEMHSLRRAITATDFERVALQTGGGIARAKAFAPAQYWKHAMPGTVAVMLVPELTKQERGPADTLVRRDLLEARQTSFGHERVQAVLDERRPLGTICQVRWARYKAVTVKSRIVVHRTAEPDAIRKRILERLHTTLSPLASGGTRNGWAFGRELRTSNVYEVILSEPGVDYVQDVELHVDPVPQAVSCMAYSVHEPKVGFAGCGTRLFRTVNAGIGWECLREFEGESIAVICSDRLKPGLLAVATRAGDGSKIFFSGDLGDSWTLRDSVTLPTAHDMAFCSHDGATSLLVATAAGLYRIGLELEALPLLLVVDRNLASRCVYQVESALDASGQSLVAVVLDRLGGVLLSRNGGANESFEVLGMTGKNVQRLMLEIDGTRRFLWAGIAVTGDEVGEGCAVLEVRSKEEQPDFKWAPLSQGWSGGSCNALACAGGRIYAATIWAGILSRDARENGSAWQRPKLESGLPYRSGPQVQDQNRLFQPVNALTVTDGHRILAGAEGIVRSRDKDSYEAASRNVFRGAEMVTVPHDWLLCSGTHEIGVTQNDESQ